MNTMMPAESQLSIPLDDDTILAMGIEEREFWLNLFEQADREINSHKVSKRPLPYPPSGILKAYFKHALRAYNGSRYSQIRKIAEIFALPPS